MLHKSAEQREPNSRGIYDPAALSQIKALLFDTFATVVDWRSSLSAEDLDELTGAWHRLHPLPDVLEGMQRLATRYFLGPLSNANVVARLVRLRKFCNLPWDFILGADLWKRYKPDPEAYLGACRLLGLRPDEVMLVAAHNYSLARSPRSEQGL